MKVLQINLVCGRGSTGRIVTDIARALRENGNECMAAYSQPPALRIDAAGTYRVGSKTDYYLHNILSRLTDHEGCYSRLATRRLIKKIREYDPDVIHLHNIHGHWLNYKILFDYLSKANKPVVWTLHDCWAFTGHCPNFTVAKCDQWKSHCSHCPELKKYPECYTRGDVYRNFERKRAAFASVKNMTLVTPSRWLADLVGESFLSGYPVKVINNGIDLDVFKPTPSNFREKHGLRNKRIVLGVAGVWTEEKGLYDFYELANRLDNSFAIVLVGLTEEQIKACPPRIIGISRTDSVKQLAEIYTAADVFFNPSRQETFGMTNLEAAVCGTRPIVYKGTACEEVAKAYKGIAVETGDIDAAIKAIYSAEKLDCACVQIIAHRFSDKLKYKEYIDLYNSMQEER